MTVADDIRGAVISEDGRYRYSLHRVWDTNGLPLVWSC